MMRYRRDYTRLTRPQRKSARTIAKSGIPSGDDPLDKGAFSWAVSTFMASTSAASVFLFAGLAYALIFHKYEAAFLVICAFAGSASVALRRKKRIRFLHRMLVARTVSTSISPCGRVRLGASPSPSRLPPGPRTLCSYFVFSQFKIPLLFRLHLSAPLQRETHRYIQASQRRSELFAFATAATNARPDGAT